MKNILRLLIFLVGFSQVSFSQDYSNDTFPDGTAIPKWFKDYSKIELKNLGKQYVITDYGVKKDSTKVQTAAAMSHRDNSIGLLLDKLKQENLDKNTLIIFMSDNGAIENWDSKKEYNGVHPSNDRLGGIGKLPIMRVQSSFSSNLFHKTVSNINQITNYFSVL